MDFFQDQQWAVILKKLPLLVGVILLFCFWWFAKPRPKSGFKLRESDRLKQKYPVAHDPHIHDAAQSKNQSKRSSQSSDKKASSDNPAALPGFVQSEHPHEVLQVSPQATREQINHAYRELMRQYHPDQVGRPGSREWKEATEIAHRLNDAKEAMLKNFKKNAR